MLKAQVKWPSETSAQRDNFKGFVNITQQFRNNFAEYNVYM